LINDNSRNDHKAAPINFNLTGNTSNFGQDLILNWGLDLHFDGSGDYLELGALDLLKEVATGFTFECWLLIDYSTLVGTRRMSILSAYRTIVGGEHLISIEVTEERRIQASINTNGNFMRRTEPLEGEGAWLHLAIVAETNARTTGPSRKPPTMTIYLNGEEADLEDDLGTLPSNLVNSDTSNLGYFLGYNTAGAPRYYHGNIKEIRLWTGPRTQEQIEDNMYKRLAGNETDLYAYYNFEGQNIVAKDDNTAITTIEDKSSNSHEATLVGFTKNGETSNFGKNFKIT